MKTKTKRAFKANNLGSEMLPCDTACPKPRRSIPVKEVDKIVEEAIARVKSKRTIYDDRNELLQYINEVENNLKYHEHSIHNCEKNLISLKAELNKTNTAITRELDLDSLR